jgi:Family of unknown function (DUF6502)
MSSERSLAQVLDRAIAQLLRPLCRVLLRHGVSFNAFEALAKRVYVDVAMREFGIPGKKPSVSRVSILSGLTRKDVQRLVQEATDAAVPRGPAEAGAREPVNRATRVLGAWLREAEFRDAADQPLALPVQGETASFAALVRRHSGDMPVRAMLDELLRSGAVAQSEDGLLRPVQQAYVPRDDVAAKLAILGSDVADLIATIDHNLQHGATDPRYQRRVMYERIPVDSLPEFRRLSAEHAQALLVMLDRWLSEQDRRADTHPALPTARVGLGIHYIEDHRPVDSPSGAQP